MWLQTGPVKLRSHPYCSVRPHSSTGCNHLCPAALTVLHQVMDHCIPTSLLFPSHLETQGMSMRYAQTHTPLFTGAGNPTLIDTSRSIPNGVDNIVEDARQKKQNGLEFQQNVCRFPGGVNCYHSLGNRETMPVCLSLRTSYLIGITDNSALCLICTSEFLCAAVLLCEQLLSPTPYLQLKKK